MTRLNRLLSILSIFLFPVHLYSQNDTTGYSIEWKKPATLILDGKYKKVISFEQASHRRENQYLPSLLISIRGVYSTQYNLLNIEWAALTDSELLNLPENCKIGSDIISSIYNAAENSLNVTQIEVVPLRKNPSGTLEKIIKFQVQLFPSPPPIVNFINRSSQNRQSGFGSVLSQGDWYKIPFKASGVYKIDYNYIKSLGLTPEQIDPNTLQIWGNSGGMLPEPCSEPRPQDLKQIPVFVIDGNDGKFNQNDYLLLYLEGSDVWKYNKDQSYFTYSHNFYSDKAFCFLTISTSQNKKIVVENAVSDNPDLVLSSYSRRYHHESDYYNFLSSGRKWYGEEFDNIQNQTFNVPANSVLSGSSVHVVSSFLNRSPQPGNNVFNLSINSIPFISHEIPGGGSGVYELIGNDETFHDFVGSDNFAGSNGLFFNVNYEKKSGVGKGYLDYFSFTFEDNLILNANSIGFRNFNSRIRGVVQYNINLNTSSQIRVWDITDINNTTEYNVELSGSIGSFKYYSDNDTTLREFIAFSGSSFPSPEIGEKIPNQNIQTNNTPDFLIVTHPLFKNQANKLADFRREHDKMDVVVVTTEEVYNEFSSGRLDLVAIRDCAKMFNDKNKSKLKYLLLLGDCSFDYKNLKGLSDPQNFVPIYESEESLKPTETYSSDDYVGLLNDQEGLWLNYNYDLMDIGVGRLPVRTPEEAEAIVQKIIHYSSSPLTLGQWRQNLTFIADNEENNEFLDNAESLSFSSNSLINNYLTKKIYLASYAHDQGATPQANSEIQQQFENGTLIMNYIGHGGEKQLASENIINNGTITSLTNFDKMPFMVTATCDFGKYDDPTITSGGELFVFNPQGGAIGILCTTRPVFQNYNKRINKAFYDSVFTKKSNGSYLTLGEVIKSSKNNSLSGVFNRNFALLGDPSLTLAYPENSIEITKINDKAFVPLQDTLKAQSKVSISGRIVRNGTLMSDFNGVVNVLIFDKSSNVSTIELPKYSFYIRDSKIFDGSATVKNGEFSFTFIVPKNINYIVGNGKILFYANFEDGRMNDAGGGDSQVLIGSGDRNALGENTPPQIKAYLNDESFVSGGITNENPLLIVKLYDESGISSIGDMVKSISAIVNNNIKNEKKLDNYYKSDRDTYKSGTIKYKLSSADGINEGYNSVKIKAFDTFGNGIENGGTIEFNVANHQNLTIKNLLNYPNPFTTNTVFHFDHNRAGDDLDILLQVYTVTGKLVKSLNSRTFSAHTHISDLVWDGKDEFGDNIGRGVYVYKLSVKALSDGFRKDEYQKLVILN